MRFPKIWWIGFAWIIAIYILYFIFFIENRDLPNIPRKIRHIIKFTSTISVYVIGSLHMQQFNVPWMKKLWHFIHISMLLLLLLIGLYVWFIADIPYFVKQFTLTIQELLISPTIYFVMGILNQLSQEKKAPLGS